jgi:hypothetical protein
MEETKWSLELHVNRQRTMQHMKLLDIIFMPNNLNYFYQVIVIRNICITCTNFWDHEMC